MSSSDGRPQTPTRAPPPTRALPGPRALRPALGPGSLLAGRYRLRAPLPPLPDDPPQAERWSADDEVLARRVDAVVLLAAGRRAAWGRELLEAAAQAGTVSSPALAQIYDAALEEVPAERYGRAAGRVDLAYVVTEHVSGRTIAEAVQADGPLEPRDALDQVLPAVDGLAAAHARGVVHGAISPATAVLSDTEGLRLRDTAVAAALARRADGQARTGTAADDVRALAACLYALLTGRWPSTAVDAPGAGLPDAPPTAGRAARLCSPRQVRAGVPRALDAAVAAVLDPGRAGTAPVETADALGRVLRDAAAADDAHAPAVRRSVPRLPPTLVRALAVVVVVLGLVAIGLNAYGRGRDLGTVRREGNQLQTLVEATPSPVPGASPGAAVGQRIDLTAQGVSVRAFDPPPGDGGEDDGAVPNAIDADPGTAWNTEGYDTPDFGGIKPGVGLLVDLGRSVRVSQVELGLVPGADVELRAADTLAPDLSGFPVVARVTGAPAVTRLVPPQPVTARYFVVWLTRLPKQGARFRGTVSEMFFVSG